VAAMGSGVTVASPYSTTGYSHTASGTSFSCPLTAGVAALVLTANPSLTPMQVRDALRETASQSTTPDKYLGWGIINAYDAVFYLTANIGHSQLEDTEDLNGPYEVVAQIESTFPLIPAEIKLFYGNDTSFSTEIVMQPTGNLNEYSAQINGIGSTAEYFYYIEATNDQQITSRLPFNAPLEYFRFYAGPDTNLSVIIHTESVPNIFTVLQNYPNPFNPQTMIEYAMPNAGNVELTVFNLLGQQIFEKNMGNQKAGRHKFVFNGSTFSSGVYFYRLKVKEQSGKILVQTRKMVCIQ
jgi:hypothetical protein